MIKFYWFFIATCFLSQLPQDHGISDWYFKSPGCISCFRYITKLYYTDLDAVSPNCSPGKYDDLKNVIRYTTNNYVGFNVCFNTYKDMFEERFKQMQQQMDKVFKDFIKCFEKTGLKDEDKKKLDGSSDKFQTDRDFCQKTDPAMGTVYLKTENNDMLQTFRDNYKKIPKEPAKPDSKATPQNQSKSSDNKKDLPLPISSDTSKDNKPPTDQSTSGKDQSSKTATASTDKSTERSKAGQPPNDNFPQNASGDPSQAMKSSDRRNTSSSVDLPTQGLSQDDSFRSQQSRFSSTPSTDSSSNYPPQQQRKPSNGADDYWRSGDGSQDSNPTSMDNQGLGNNV